MGDSTRTRPVEAARSGLVVLAGLALLALLAAACSSTSSKTAAPATTRATTGAVTSPSVIRPAGPVATIGGPLTGGQGIALAAASTGPSLASYGYSEAEYTASGTATAYAAPDGLPANGRYDLQPTSQASYETRIVVRRPTNPAKFNGTVVVEWLNVSAGADSSPDWTYLADELIRGGYAWVGVSAQAVGVIGGPGL